MKTINDINIKELLNNSFEDISLVKIHMIIDECGYMNISKLEDWTKYITYIEDFKNWDELVVLDNNDIDYISTLLK